MKQALAFVFIFIASIASSQAGQNRVDDADKLMGERSWAESYSKKLEEIEKATGIKMVAYFRAKEPDAEADKVPGVVMQGLAVKAGVSENGILIGYFAAEDDWRVWIGDKLASQFAGKAGTVKELTESGAIHDVKEPLLDSAQKKGGKEFVVLQEKSGSVKPLAKMIKTQLQAEAIADALSARFLATGQSGKR